MYTNPYAFKDLSNNYLIPTVIENNHGRAGLTLFPPVKRPHYYACSQIDDDIANIVVAQLLFLESQKNERYQTYINSQAGLSRQGWRFMMPCNTSNRMFQRLHRNGRLMGAFFWLAERKGNDSHYPTPKS